MINKSMSCNGVGRCSIAVVVGGVLLGLSGCAGESAKPAPTISPDHVQGHADKAFEKLKQEEKNRALPPGSPY